MNYVMKCIQIFDKNKTSWQNYNSCISTYNDPNSILVLVFSNSGFDTQIGDNRSPEWCEQCGQANAQNKANSDGIRDSFHIDSYLSAVRQEEEMCFLQEDPQSWGEQYEIRR